MELLLPKMGLLFWTLLMVIALVLFLYAIIDIVRSDFKDSSSKVVWILIVLFAPLIGSVIYLIMGKNQKNGR
jgi:hypothetical protein